LLPDLKLETSPVPQTISERPTIYLLTPKVENGTIRLRIFDESGLTTKRVYSKVFSINNQDGIVAFKIPDDAPILEINKKYKLTTISPISLRTYEELSLKIENWGEFDSIKTCMNRAMSVLKGFQTYFLTDKENDGNYYKY
jgi:hypothetical protein